MQGTTDAGLSSAQFLGALGTGILKSTTTTGILSIAVAGDFPTLNQSTTGTAANATLAVTATTATGANALYSATTTVSVSGATAPTTGQILTAINSTSANWQTLSATTAAGLTTLTTTVNISGQAAPSAGQVLTATSSTVAGWSTPSSSSNATTVAIVDDTSTAATMYPVWVTGTTGNYAEKTSTTKLTFNPSTGNLFATNLSVGDTVVTLANGVNQNIAITSGFMRVAGPSAVFSLSGFTGGVNGQIITVWNNNAFVMTVNYNDAGSTYNIRTSTHANVAVGGTGVYGWASFQYASAYPAWILLGHS